MKLEPMLAREAAKAEAREMTGLTLNDLRRLENAGHDYASINVGGKTQAKLRRFDDVSRSLARLYPEHFGRVDAGADTEDYSRAVWDMIREGKAELTPLSDAKLLREAAETLQRYNRYEPVAVGAENEDF